MKAQYVYENINETYDSFTELQKIKRAVEGGIQKDLKEKTEEDSTVYVPSSYVNSNEYKILPKEFINGVGIIMHPERDNSSYFNPTTYKRILKSPEEADKYLKKYPAGIIILEDLYSLLHELQHAYDWYRSQGKSFANHYDPAKIKKSFSEKGASVKGYFRDQMELSAFFVQAIDDLDIEKFDDLKSAWQAFKRKFYPWEWLNPKLRKKYANKFSQYYHRNKYPEKF